MEEKEKMQEFNSKEDVPPNFTGKCYVKNNLTTCYYLDGKLHRTDGPAKEYCSGEKNWRKDGKLHRLDVPALEFASGDKYWYVEGKYLSEKEFNALPEVIMYKAGLSMFV